MTRGRLFAGRHASDIFMGPLYFSSLPSVHNRVIKGRLSRGRKDGEAESLRMSGYGQVKGDITVTLAWKYAPAVP